jgi:leucine dehydrogenase
MPGDIFERMAHRDHEQVVFCSDRASGLRAIIAVHNTTLGPALGGCRMWPYATESEALEDVLRLSRGMTYKAAVAGLNLGGGKAVIMGDPKKDKSEALFRSFGRFVHSLGGRYITAEDVGTGVREIEWVRMETPYVTGIGRALGGSGDPSPMTAWGVYIGMKACTRRAFQTSDLSRFTVAIQGLGSTGYWLAKYLHQDGVRLFVTDIDEDRVRQAVEEFGAEGVSPDAIYDLDVDVFAPCALGGVINDDTLKRLRCKIVAGSANNVLAEEERHGPMLREKGILYAPDYVINCGGLINVANEIEGYNAERAKRQVEHVYDVLDEIFEITKREDIPAAVAANRVAEQRIARLAATQRTWVGNQEVHLPRRRSP